MCGEGEGLNSEQGDGLFFFSPFSVSFLGREHVKFVLWEIKNGKFLNILGLPLSSIYKVHDEAKDKAFELEMSWVCDESKRQHEKVLSSLSILLFICGRTLPSTYMMLSEPFLL